MRAPKGIALELIMAIIGGNLYTERQKLMDV